MTVGTPTLAGPTNKAANSSGTTIATTVGAAGVPAGNDIIVLASASTATTTGWSCTDSATNSYSLLSSWPKAIGGSTTAAVLIAHNVAALVNTNTITVTTPTASWRATAALTCSGLDVSSLDINTTASGTSTTPASGTSGTTARGPELALGIVFWNLGPASGDSVTETFSSETGITTNLGTANANGGTGGSARTIGLRVNYSVLTTTQTLSYGCTLGHTDNWLACALSFKGIGAWAYANNNKSATLFSSTSVTAAFTNNTTVGNRAICVVNCWQSGTTSPTITSVSDSKNGTWQQDASFTYADTSSFSGTIGVFSILIGVQLLNSDPVTMSFGSTIGGGRCGLLEYSGLGSAVDVSHTATSNNTASNNPSSGATGNTAVADEMVLSVYADDGYNRTWSTAPVVTARINQMADGTNGELYIGDLDSGAAASAITTSGTLSGTANWGMATIVYAFPAANAFPAGFGVYGHTGQNQVTQMIVQ